MSGQLRAGTVRALVTGGASRIAELPDVPTIAEAGFKGFDVETWFGVTAPPKTPGNATAELVAWFGAGLRSDVVRQKLAAQGFGSVGRCGAEFGSLLRQSYDRIRQMVGDAKMKTE
jgi:tripartite-type tricarboxylate transporter receptor subunit TctC